MSRGLRIALVAAVAVVVLGLIGGGVFMFLSFQSKVDKAIAVQFKSAEASAGAMASGEGALPSEFMKMKEFVTELADPAPKIRYVQVTISLGFATVKEKDDAGKYEPVIRNTILQILRGKTSADLTGKDGMIQLEKELHEMLHKLEPLKASLKKTSITDLVIQ